MVVCHSGGVSLWQSVTEWQFVTVAMYHCDSVSQWLCVTVAVCHSGRLSQSVSLSQWQ